MSAIQESDFPALYRAADAASVAAQRRYVRLMQASLALMVVGAAFAAIPSTLMSSSTGATISAALLALSLVMTFVVQSFGFEKVWYGGRAVAESVKSLAWKYMTRAGPYGNSLDEPDGDRQLTADLGAILEERKHLSYAFGGSVATGAQITGRMRSIRASDLITRKTTYLRERIEDQRDWYGKKSAGNQTRSLVFFALIAISQGLAMVWAIRRITAPPSSLNLVGFFSALAAAWIAWNQLRQHRELAQSYGLAAHELGLVAEESVHVATDEQLGNFVVDAEKAISREHTMWVARRDRS